MSPHLTASGSLRLCCTRSNCPGKSSLFNQARATPHFQPGDHELRRESSCEFACSSQCTWRMCSGSADPIEMQHGRSGRKHTNHFQLAGSWFEMAILHAKGTTNDLGLKVFAHRPNPHLSVVQARPRRLLLPVNRTTLTFFAPVSGRVQECPAPPMLD